MGNRIELSYYWGSNGWVGCIRSSCRARERSGRRLRRLLDSPTWCMVWRSGYLQGQEGHWREGRSGWLVYGWMRWVRGPTSGRFLRVRSFGLTSSDTGHFIFWIGEVYFFQVPRATDLDTNSVFGHVVTAQGIRVVRSKTATSTAECCPRHCASPAKIQFTALFRDMHYMHSCEYFFRLDFSVVSKVSS